MHRTWEAPRCPTPPTRGCARAAAPRLQYDLVYYGHLGWYRCPSCDLRRPTPSITVVEASSRGDRGSSLVIETPRGPIAAEVRLPGVYNVYNALAAVAACSELDVPVADYPGGSGDLQRRLRSAGADPVDDRELFLALVKNPVGFTEVLRTILDAGSGRRTLVLAINDLFADGTDVSWLWDVDFERLAGRVERGGVRRPARRGHGGAAEVRRRRRPSASASTPTCSSRRRPGAGRGRAG